jgi:5'-nucleotidase
MRIFVTNDDGIDSVGLHVLARAMNPLGEVTVVAPDSEYSGAGAAVGALHLMRPEVHRAHIDGIADAWSVSGPPALCILFARLGLFGAQPDLVVSGINPGANVGRAVYHSGTVGAALTARSGGISGVAVSQEVVLGDIDGQGSDFTLGSQNWKSAAEVAAVVVASMLANMPKEPVVLNLNVPNLHIAEMRGWKQTLVGTRPPRTLTAATLEPKPGHDGAFRVVMDYGEPVTLPVELDGGAVTAGYVSICALSRLSAEDPPENVVLGLDALFGAS